MLVTSRATNLAPSNGGLIDHADVKDPTAGRSWLGGVRQGLEAAAAGRGPKGGMMTEQTLYERLGGVNAIAMVVDRFSDQIVINPKLNVNPALREWNGKGLLPGLKFMRTLWICAATGGPFQYTGRELGEAHEDLHLTSEEFDEVGAEIDRALDHFDVPQREQQELLAAIVARKDEVVNPA